MMQGSTNRSSGNDSDVTGLLCATDAVELANSAPATESADSGASVEQNADSWRLEVAARLERYRTRRKPRTPRYPSLLLPFDAPESWSRTAPPTGSGSAAVAAVPAEHDFASHSFELNSGAASLRDDGQMRAPAPTQAVSESTLEVSAKVIEFPRSAAIPVFQTSGLADPVFDCDRPRIVEAPEMVPPPPALGGMLIEPAPQEMADRPSDFVSVLPSAPVARRALAAAVDGAIVVAALAGFAAVSLHFNPFQFNPFRLNHSPHPMMDFVRGPVPAIAGALVVVAVLLWAVYQYVFVVYTGSTPGLRAARLRLAASDGSPLNRRLRRWRVLASFLSAFSAGLGYFWCVLDQHGLCWHDRITRSHVEAEEAE